MAEIDLARHGRLVLVTWPEHPTEAGIHDLFSRLDRIYAERIPVALILDARATRSATSAVREATIEAMKKRKTVMQQFLVGQATVLSSALVRGALTAIHFMAPPGYPTKNFSDLEEAKRWAEAQLSDRRTRAS